jgi:hypothetical protein
MHATHAAADGVEPSLKRPKLPMLVINVVIVRQVDDRQPGFVECKLTDRFGREWFFMEKGPVVYLRALGARIGRRHVPLSHLRRSTEGT